MTLPHVKIIQYGSSSNTFELESVTFSSNSELRKIEECAFANRRMQKPVLPAGIKEIAAMILLPLKSGILVNWRILSWLLPFPKTASSFDQRAKVLSSSLAVIHEC